MSRRGDPIDVEPHSARVMQPVYEFQLEDMDGADVQFVHRERGWRHPHRESLAAVERRQRLVTGGNSLGTERARRRICMKLTGGSCQKVQKLLDRHEVRGACS